MIDFMIVALPRSGTAWLSNWFTTDRSICWHEALMDDDLAALDRLSITGLFGISETALILQDVDVLNRHPARKLIVHRPLRDVNASLAKLGLPPMDKGAYFKLDEIGGHHITYDALWDVHKFRKAHEAILPTPFDTARYATLRKLNIQNAEAIRCVQEMLA